MRLGELVEKNQQMKVISSDIITDILRNHSRSNYHVLPEQLISTELLVQIQKLCNAKRTIAQKYSEKCGEEFDSKGLIIVTDISYIPKMENNDGNVDGAINKVSKPSKEFRDSVLSYTRLRNYNPGCTFNPDKYPNIFVIESNKFHEHLHSVIDELKSKYESDSSNPEFTTVSV